MKPKDSVISLRSGKLLLKIRIWFYSIAFAHLLVTALVSLSIDMSGDQDPRISAYISIRWKLLTCWFNMITLGYFPICLYCDWKELSGQWDLKQVAALRQLKDYVMTGILFPVTLFADCIFWRIWNNDVNLLAPPRIFTYLPYWTHHSLHTVSFIIMILDLLLVPRRRPQSLWPGIFLLMSFITIYSLVCRISFINGEVVYALFKMFDSFKLLMLGMLATTECLFFYFIQWCIVDLVWGQKYKFQIKLN